MQHHRDLGVRGSLSSEGKSPPATNPNGKNWLSRHWAATQSWCYPTEQPQRGSSLSGNHTKSGLTTPFIEGIISFDAIAFQSGEMVKKANLQPHLTSTELKTRYLCSSDRVESRRWH